KGKHSLEYRTGDILEIDVDTFRAGCRKAAAEIRCPMVDAGIEAEFFGNITAFLWSSGDADGVGTLNPGDWPTTEPTAPEAAATTTVSPAAGLPISRSPMYAVIPGIPRTPSAV